jgi:hypothetical protein
MDKQLADYRETLLKMEQEAQGEYDKAVLALSGGALGVSFAFLKDFVGPENVTKMWSLAWAWGAWGISSTLVLISFFTSHVALRRAIRQVDESEGDYEKLKGIGGVPNFLTKTLNLGGLALFLLGVGMMIFFVMHNLRTSKSAETPTSTAAAPAATQPKNP